MIETKPPQPSGQQPAWLSAMRRYLIALAGGNVVWEVAQLPLYTIWTEGQWREITFAAAHCTAGDVLIATATLVLACSWLGTAGLMRGAPFVEWPRLPSQGGSDTRCSANG